MFCHVFGDRGLSDIDAELEELTVDPGSAPEGIGQAHVADQLADFQRHLRSAAATLRLPSPERNKVSGATCLLAVDHPSCSKLKL